jgi:hypothetical protein
MPGGRRGSSGQHAEYSASLLSICTHKHRAMSTPTSSAQVDPIAGEEGKPVDTGIISAARLTVYIYGLTSSETQSANVSTQ